MKKVVLFSILSFVFGRCSKNDTEVSKVDPQLEQHIHEVKAQTTTFGDHLNWALEAQLTERATAAPTSRKALDFNAIEKEVVERMEKAYPGYSKAHHDFKYKLQKQSEPSNRLANGVNLSSEVQRYLDRIVGALEPAIKEFVQTARTPEDFGAFKKFYSSKMDKLVNEIRSSTTLADSSKYALVSTAYAELNTFTAKIILMSDALGQISHDDLTVNISPNNRIQGWFSNLISRAWNSITSAVSSAFSGDTWCVVGVYGSHMGVGALAGGLFGATVGTPFGPIGSAAGGAGGALAGAWGGARSAYNYMRNNPGAC